MNAPDLARALERAIAAEPDRWAKTKTHVSDTRHALKDQGCPRQLYLRLNGAKARDDTLGERLMFMNGRRLHNQVIELIREGLAGSDWQVSVTEHSVISELKASGLGIERGRLDLELIRNTNNGDDRHRSQRFVVDIKTWRGIAFKYLTEPKRPHVVQLQTYMMLRDADQGVLLYIDRDGQNACRQFHVQRDDATVQRAARVLTKIARGPEPSPLPAGPRGGKPWPCSYCAFLGTACEGPTGQLTTASKSARAGNNVPGSKRPNLRVVT